MNSSFPDFVLHQLQRDWPELGNPSEVIGPRFAEDIESLISDPSRRIYIDGVIDRDFQPAYWFPTGDDPLRVHLVRVSKNEKLNELDRWLCIMFELERIKKYNDYNALMKELVVGNLSGVELPSKFKKIDNSSAIQLAKRIINSKELDRIPAGKSFVLDHLRELSARDVNDDVELLSVFDRGDSASLLTKGRTVTWEQLTSMYRPKSSFPSHSDDFGERMVKQFLVD
ncbi:MAG: hypothetical protein MUC83_17610, partial [Pirellula sp.]|nr:hypothetical protein [Pirellula sp.]